MSPRTHQNFSFIKNDQEQQNFAALIQAYTSKQLIPYVGAGFSMNSHQCACPSWGTFLQQLYQQNQANMHVEEQHAFEQAFEKYHYETALDQLVTVVGKAKFFRQVEQQFDKPQNEQLPAAFKQKFELFHQVFKGPWLTTNLDRFIEATCPQGAGHITTIAGYQDPRFTDDLNRGDLNGYLFKLHGDAKSRPSLVFAREQYIAAYGDETRFDLTEKLPELLKRVFQNYSLLFIGCSLTIDRPLQILQQLAEQGGVKPQFALLRREDFSGDDNIDKRRKLDHLDITPIYLDDFCEINQVLSALLAATGSFEPNPIDDDLQAPDVFVGREQPLQTLIDSITQASQTQTPANSVLAITEDYPHLRKQKSSLNHLQGHGGIGKTTLARQVMHQCAHLFEASFEIRIDSIEPMEFAKQLAAKLGHSGIEFNNNQSAKQFIQQQLNQRRLLLLLDNVDSGAVLLELLPQSYQSCIIATSRDNELADLIALKRNQLQLCAIELEKFTRDEALALFKQLLKQRYQTDEESIYLAIAASVDYLPIALRLAITTMVFGNKLSAHELLAQLEHNPHLVLDDQACKLDINQQERSILAVFDLSTPLLNPQLTYCLALIAVCEQGKVAEDFLQALHQQVIESDVMAIALTPEQLVTQLRILERYSWCKRTTLDAQHYYELHQIVRRVVTNELIHDKLQSLDLEALFVDSVQHHFITKPQHFNVLDRWINQTDKAVEWLKQQHDKRLIEWAAKDFCQFCMNRGFGERFMRYCQWLRQVFVDDQPRIAMSLGHQALILRRKGQLDEALALHQQEQQIYQQLDDKAGLSRTYCGQALILRRQGHLDEALELHQQEQQICQQLSDKAGLSRSYGNQAVILQTKGQLDEALALLQQVQEICQQLGDKADLSRTYGNQAVILQTKDQLDEALALHQKNQQIKEQLGDKAGLAISLANQSLIYEQWDDLPQALDLCQQAIALRKTCGIPTDEWEQWVIEWQQTLNDQSED